MEVNEDIVYRNLAQRIFLGVREHNCSRAGRAGELFFLKLHAVSSDTHGMINQKTDTLIIFVCL